MRDRRAGLFALLGTLLLLVLSACGGGGQGTPAATAELKDKEGKTVGNAQFSEDENGVNITATILQGLEPGEHGIHIHEKADITPDFEAAGEHFNPAGAKHGSENPQGPHAGDLENITVREDGTADYNTTTDRVTLSDGENSLLDEDGSALVIHAKADDYRTDPSGGTGDRIVAGVIQSS